MKYLDETSKWQNDLSSFPRHTIQYDSNPSLCPNQQCWRSWSWMDPWRPTRSSRINTQRRCPFHYRGLEKDLIEVKKSWLLESQEIPGSRKSRNTWSNRQIWPWSTEWSRAKANRVLSREHTGLYTLITRWSIPKSDWLYSLQPKMEKLYTVSKNTTRRSWWWLRSWTPHCQIQT